MNFTFIALFILHFGSILTQVRFDSYQVFRILPRTRRQLNNLFRLRVTYDGYDFWNDASNLNVTLDVMVSPDAQDNFRQNMHDVSIKPRIMIKNVQTLIDNEKRMGRIGHGGFGWQNYQTLPDINAWLVSLVEKYPNVVTVVKGGRSYENRDILGIKISYKTGNKAVFVEGGTHAREWIGPATVTYIANEILSNPDPSIRATVESRDWYFFPVINPDGYIYTQTNRLWKKNRQPYGDCIGVDLDSNWDYKWMKGGATNSSCSEYYAGPHAFSEIETKSLSEFITSIQDDLEGYIAFHSFAQVLTYPFGDVKSDVDIEADDYDLEDSDSMIEESEEVASNYEELDRIGRRAVEALSKRFGTQYRVGSVNKMFNLASGSSMEWVVSTFKHVRLAYTYELRDNGTYGFLLPPQQIIPTCQETFDSFITIFQEADAGLTQPELLHD